MTKDLERNMVAGAVPEGLWKLSQLPFPMVTEHGPWATSALSSC